MFRRFHVSELSQLQPRRICLIKPSALGDVVQTIPLLNVLRQRFPDASISWVINRELRDLVDGHPALAESIPFERRGGWRAWMNCSVRYSSGNLILPSTFKGFSEPAR